MKTLTVIIFGVLWGILCGLTLPDSISPWISFFGAFVGSMLILNLME